MATEIDNGSAYKLLVAACKVLTKQYGFDLRLNKYPNGQVCITSSDREIASITVEHDDIGVMFFDSCIELLEALMVPRTTIYFHPSSYGTRLSIDFSKEFGTSIDEIMINLDLKSLQS